MSTATIYGAPWFASVKTLAGVHFVSAASIIIQIMSGVTEYPPIPPGAIILAVTGLIVGFVPWRWTPILSLLVTGFLILGGLQSPSFLKRLTVPSDVGAFIGTTLSAICLVAGLIVTVAAIVYAIRDKRRPAASTY